MSDHVFLTAEKLNVEEVISLASSPDCGATSVFIGSTREFADDKIVKHLEYEAYTPMAEVEMRKICRNIREKWPVKHIVMHHRMSQVPVGEASVVIAVSSEHRVVSLDAVAFAINSLKASVPIWKKESYEEGEGEWKQNKECIWQSEKK